MAKGRPRKKISLEDFPFQFRRALIKFMADRRIDDFDDAFLVLARYILDFDKAVKSDADTLYRRRHFTEMNKTIATREKQAEQRGYARGHQKAKNRYEITFPCKICNAPITVQPDSEVHKAILDHLYEKGWRHSECVG